MIETTQLIACDRLTSKLESCANAELLHLHSVKLEETSLDLC